MQISFSDRPLPHPFAPPRIALLSKVSIGKFKSHFTIGLNLNSNAVLPLGHKMLCSSQCVCVCVGEHLLLLFVLVLVTISNASCFAQPLEKCFVALG